MLVPTEGDEMRTTLVLVVVLMAGCAPVEEVPDPPAEVEAPEPEPTPERDAYAAAEACEQFIDRDHGNPEHGDLSDYRATEVSPPDTRGGWILLGELADGTRWRCEVLATEDGWDLVGLDLPR